MGVLKYTSTTCLRTTSSIKILLRTREVMDIFLRYQIGVGVAPIDRGGPLSDPSDSSILFDAIGNITVVVWDEVNVVAVPVE